jgi:hypothetical protein
MPEEGGSSTTDPTAPGSSPDPTDPEASPAVGEEEEEDPTQPKDSPAVGDGEEVEEGGNKPTGSGKPTDSAPAVVEDEASPTKKPVGTPGGGVDLPKNTDDTKVPLVDPVAAAPALPPPPRPSGAGLAGVGVVPLVLAGLVALVV